MCLLLNMEKIEQYNILIVGDGGVGKTRFINKLNKKSSSERYIPTYGVTQYKFKKYNIIDTSGQEKYSKIPFNDKIHGAIIMFSLESHISCKNIQFFHEKIVKVYGNIPIIICGNTFSKTENKLSQEMITYHLEFNLKYFEISNNEEIIIRCLSDQINNKLFYENLQNYVNKFLEIKDKEISELTAKIDFIKKLI